MSPEHVALHETARREAIRLYARAYDEWATEEQKRVQEGEYDAAALAHENARIILTAYRGEVDDPDLDILR